MKTNLSSQIVLRQIPKKYYQPDSALEASGISRYEKINTFIGQTALEGAKRAAAEVAELIRAKAAEGKKCVLGLNSGRSPIEFYEELVRLHREEGLSFANVVVFNLFEYYPLDVNYPQSCLNQIKTMLFDHIDIAPEHIFSPDPSVPQSQIFAYCADYERKIEEFGGIDYQILGIGGVGNI